MKEALEMILGGFVILCIGLFLAGVFAALSQEDKKEINDSKQEVLGV